MVVIVKELVTSGTADDDAPEGASIEAKAEIPSRMIILELFGGADSSCNSSPSSSDGPRLRSEKRSNCLEESNLSARLCKRRLETMSDAHSRTDPFLFF